MPLFFLLIYTSYNKCFVIILLKIYITFNNDELIDKNKDK